ncbi:hypothetical protein ScPMuIL_006262 [Solemya velum]
MCNRCGFCSLADELVSEQDERMNGRLGIHLLRPGSGQVFTDNDQMQQGESAGFHVQGQSVKTTERAGTGTGTADQGTTKPARPSTTGTSPQRPLSSQLMEMNRTLEMQIEALRLRLDFDAKHHENEKAAIVAERDSQVKEKDDEIEALRDLLLSKDEKLQNILRETQSKSENILEMQMQVDELRNDVNYAKDYSTELQKELASMQDQKNRLENGNAYKDKEHEICMLETGINELKTSMSMLLRELEKAKQTITTQNSRIRYLENDKRNIQLKFKEEILKATQTMRHEIEKMRDVMNGQWREMKYLREQITVWGVI